MMIFFLDRPYMVVAPFSAPPPDTRQKFIVSIMHVPACACTQH
jgi:hypothetical protein